MGYGLGQGGQGRAWVNTRSLGGSETRSDHPFCSSSGFGRGFAAGRAGPRGAREGRDEASPRRPSAVAWQGRGQARGPSPLAGQPRGSCTGGAARSLLTGQ